MSIDKHVKAALMKDFVSNSYVDSPGSAAEYSLRFNEVFMIIRHTRNPFLSL